MNLRFFEPEFDSNLTSNFILNEVNSYKIITVLRLQVGTIIYIFNNTKVEFTAKIIALKATKVGKRPTLVEVEILQSTIKHLESPIKIHLVPAILKHDNMDWIIQKAVELGVEQITPMITDRTIVQTTPSQLNKKILHWQAIAINASCQCGRTIVPQINTSLMFEKIICAYSATNINKFICSPDDQNILCSQTIEHYQLRQHKTLEHAKEFMLLIGPEGGFCEQEIKLAKNNQFLCVKFGARVLRAETAAIVAISLFQSQYGDLLCSIN